MSENIIQQDAGINLFEGIFINATIGMLVMDEEGKIIAANPFALKEFGYVADDLVGNTMEMLMPSYFQNVLANDYKKLIARGKTWSIGEHKDLFAIRKSGSEFPVEITMTSYFSDGHPYVVACFHNISANKEREALIEKLHDEREISLIQRSNEHTEAGRLEEKRAFEKAILDNAGVMIIATDEKGLITFFNHEASLNTGYDEKEVINKKTPLLFHDKNEIDKKRFELSEEEGTFIKDDFDVLVATARKGKLEEEEFTYIRKDKTSFPVSLTITALKNHSNKTIGFMGVAIDVTERRKAKDELRNVQQLFFQLLENYPDGSISVIDNQYRFIFTGGQLHRHLGADQKELIGGDIYPNFPGSLRNIVLNKLKEVFQTKQAISNFELPQMIIGNTYMMDAFPLSEEDGTLNQIGVIIRNISGLKKTEEGLRHDLEKEKELGELKSRFVSMASHEFRTPLSTVLSSAYLVEKYTTAEDQPKREKHLQRIVSSVSMLTEILNDFLSLGKIEEGKIQVTFSEFNVEKVINDTVREMKNGLKKDQKITYAHEGSPEVFLDVSLLKFIVMNLVSNAVKFSPEGSLVNIRTAHKNQHFLLSVKDQGMGISKQDQEHLMERFFRGANATNIQGTGLGLHIVSRYAELMNGTVECKSELEKGTEFITTFDCKDR